MAIKTIPYEDITFWEHVISIGITGSVGLLILWCAFRFAESHIREAEKKAFDKECKEAFRYLADPYFPELCKIDFWDGKLRGLEVRFWMFLLRVPKAEQENVMVSFRYTGYDKHGAGGRWLSYRLGFMSATGMDWNR